MDLNALTDSMDLKVRELLKEVQLDYSPSFTKLVDDTVSAIKEAIDEIPEDLKITADVAPGFVRDIGADKVEFNFKKPKSIEIGGSYAIKCIAKPHIYVDLFVQLPKKCFHQKDYLNYRYHAKRCLYLCIIKKHLTSSSLVRKVDWSTLQNEARKPVLIVYPAVNFVEAPGFLVRIIPVATSLFCISKLNLERNNLRAKHQGGTPTPMYNTSILEDMFIEDTAKFVKKTFLGWKELREALILLKVWARQRTSIYVHDCLSGFLLSVILSYLANRNQIKNSMGTMQIFRVTLSFIAKSTFWKNGLYFQLAKENALLEEKQKYKETFPVVICDQYANVNLAFRMTSFGFSELQNESALTLRCFEECREGGFEEIFMTRIDFPAKYDHCIRLNLKGNKEVYASGICLDNECWRLYEHKVHNVLTQGMGNRVKSVRVIWRNMPSECNIENGFSIFNSEPLLIGVSLSSLEIAFSVVDIGPNAEYKEQALKFRKFWGEKAELRRFKDGKIAESTVWECKQWERHLILKRIAEFVLFRHLSLSKENITYIVDQLDFSLVHGVGDPISSFGSLLSAFEILSKHLRLIQDIPLKISAVQPLDSAFRFTSVFPPEPHPLANKKGGVLRLPKFTPFCIQPLEVMLQLEGSGNWPMDDVAIEKTKSAFLLRIGESLQKNWGMICTATEDNVDVFFSGYAFRLKILHERGLNLLRKENENYQVKRVSSTDKELFFRSQHSGMINGLQGRYPIYSPVVRLAKRWIASHMFSTCLVEEAIELLVAFIFLKPLPYNAPSSRLTGFLRFLELLSDYNWTFSPLIVDINKDLHPSDEKEINDHFMRSRKAYQASGQNLDSAMFLSTAYDKSSEAWTRFSPNSSELKRLVAYARSSARLMTRLILEDHMDSYRWECLYRTPLNNFDAVILLHRDKLPYPQRLLFPSELNQGIHVAQGNASKVFHPFLLPGDLKQSSEELRNKLMINFDPLRCYIGDLEKEYSNAFKIWYDSLGGDAVGLTWGTCSKKRGREEETEEVKDHHVNMLRGAGEMGKGFVRSIYCLKAPRLAIVPASVLPVVKILLLPLLLYSFLAAFFAAKTPKEFSKTLRELSQEYYQMASTMIFMDCSSSTTTRCLLPLTRCPLRRTIHGMGSQRWLIGPPNHSSCRTLTLRSSASPSPLVNATLTTESSAKVIDGKYVAKTIREEIAAEVSRMKDAIGIVPGLAVIIVGDRKDSASYVRQKRKACDTAGINSFEVRMDENSTEQEVLKFISDFNDDPSVHGILVQLPLPSHMNVQNILNAVCIEKDVDGFHPLNIGRLAMRDREPLFVPCTPKGCIELLHRYDIGIRGKRAVVIGRSNIVGMPAALLLQREDATVSVVHSRTKNPEELTKQADIVIAAIGKANMVRGSWIKDGAVVIDVGINPVEDAKSPRGYSLVGDVCYDEVSKIASAITPVPGGVGPMTVAMLLSNTLIAAQRTHNFE
ncbi:hypothetical protein FNV43_RR15227 [Rhamnella rubrinervis]|uniref:Methenyltetrahydrofolate cyclohydrolase n=1 Tax=Rhamnella rubrinervis TaxID=2594499 RepID=A0A8K0E8C3_9ROSA|nr:hypothetical protein FNV43_RR15227 [Rhamnella rubrinervis]